MEWNWKEHNKQKHQFRSYYCFSCKQVKPCGILTKYTDWKDRCCPCYFQGWQVRNQEYLNYQVAYQQEVKKQEQNFQQLKLLKSYTGCSQCGSKEIDAYELYVENKLVCRPCLIKKEGGSSGSISFLEKVKWYKKYWGINLTEWLENFSQLPVNADCAREWAKDSNHLNNCRCLELETKKLVDSFTGSLKEMEEKLKNCSCKKSEKVRVSYYDFANYGYVYCEKCEAKIEGAGKHGVIKNRNDPRFWGLSIQEKVLCLKCLEKFQEKMPISKRYTFNKYLKRGY